MKTRQLIERLTEELESKLPGYQFPDNGATEIHPDLVRTARFLLALLLDVLLERRGAEFVDRVIRGPREGTGHSAPSSAGTESLGLLNEISLAYRMLLAVLGLAEGYHQYDRFVSSGLGLGRTVESLKETGVSAREVEQALERMQIRLVATAHPTNIFRSIILGARREIFALIRKINEPVADEAAFSQLVGSLRERMIVKIATRFERWAKPDVLDEIRQVIGYFRSTIYDEAPDVIARLRSEFLEIYGRPLASSAHSILRFGSWVGGDMDGNPFVNAGVYRHAIEMQRRAALELFSEHLCRAAPALSMALTQDLNVDELTASISSDLERMQADRLDAQSLYPYGEREPFRLKLELMRLKTDRALHRLAHEGPATIEQEFQYNLPDEARADLAVIDRALRANGFEATAQEYIDPLLARLEIFGFHLASLDLREDSLHIGRAARLSLRVAGHDVDPALKTEADGPNKADYLRLLTEEIMNPRRIDMRRLLPDNQEAGDDEYASLFASPDDFGFVKRIYTMLEAARQAQRYVGPRSTTNLILTMTSSVEDILHALLLLKNAGLFLRKLDGVWRSTIDIVPLFETIEDLEGAEDIMELAFANAAYRAQLGARSNEQLMMLGFSDSNKDGGYFASNWSIYRAQTKLLSLAKLNSIEPRFFYGRGGSIGRGGASSRHVADSLPPGAIRNGYDLTEQGEVLSRYYVTREVAGMHLETIISAAIERNSSPDADVPAAYIDAAEKLAEFSGESYRRLVHRHAHLVSYFEDCTPREVELVKIGSRPVRRRAMQTITDLRAIPWVFRWYQSRQFIPGWYGLGSGLKQLIDERGKEFVQTMFVEWKFLRAIVENSALAISQSNLEIAGLYQSLAQDPAAAASVFAEIRREFETCLNALGDDLGCRPIEFFRKDFPVLFASQLLKQPWVDTLGVFQVNVLHRYRSLQSNEPPDSADLELTREAVVSSIEGVALGLGATG